MRIRRPGWPSLDVTAESDGSFEFVGVPDGAWTVSASAWLDDNKWHEGETSATAGDRDVTLELVKSE